jgi:hypothetical protein
MPFRAHIDQELRVAPWVKEPPDIRVNEVFAYEPSLGTMRTVHCLGVEWSDDLQLWSVLALYHDGTVFLVPEGMVRAVDRRNRPSGETAV